VISQSVFKSIFSFTIKEERKVFDLSSSQKENVADIFDTNLFEKIE
jgi:hypothetical protein